MKKNIRTLAIFSTMSLAYACAEAPQYRAQGPETAAVSESDISGEIGEMEIQQIFTDAKSSDSMAYAAQIQAVTEVSVSAVVKDSMSESELDEEQKEIATKALDDMIAGADANDCKATAKAATKLAALAINGSAGGSAQAQASGQGAQVEVKAKAEVKEEKNAVAAGEAKAAKLAKVKAAVTKVKALVAGIKKAQGAVVKGLLAKLFGKAAA